MPAKIRHLIADSAAFISNAPLRDLAENVYTVPEVIAESCDKATRRRLKDFPVEVTYKEPSSEAMIFVTDFSRKTGDFGSLSSVDLKVLALTYDVVKQHEGVKAVKQEPDTNSSFVFGKASNQSNNRTSPLQKVYGDGDFLPSHLIMEGSEEEDDDDDDIEIPLDDQDDFLPGSDDTEQRGTANKEESAKTKDGETPATELDNEDMEDADDALDRQEEEIDEDEDSLEEDEDDDDDDDWITPSNIAAVKRSMGVEDAVETSVCVGCLTTDFAMQNVLVQMGLKVIAVDGKLIKQVKTYVLRCFGCFKITKDTSKKFCPHCGNKTLRRLSTSLAEDGTVRYHLAKNFTNRIRGMKYSLPKPQGGKHALNPTLTADQPRPDQRMSKKALQKVDILSADVIAGSSPFKMNDVTSRAAQLGLSQRPQWAKRNPNENNRKGKTRRKK